MLHFLVPTEITHYVQSHHMLGQSSCSLGIIFSLREVLFVCEFDLFVKEKKTKNSEKQAMQPE